jgi:hypothetical protein
MEALVCSHCCAPLTPPVGREPIRCRFCGTYHVPPAPPVVDFDDDDDDDDFDEDDDDETIPMTDDAVLALLREHFNGIDPLYLYPSLPQKKERNVRRIHAAHLPPHEYILAIYDDTVFGSAEEGFVVTSRRLCFKNISESPQMLDWRTVDPDDIYQEGSKIAVGRARLDTVIGEDSPLFDACETVFPILARSAKKAAASPAQAAKPVPQGPVSAGHPPAAQQGHGGYGPPPSGYGAYGPPSAGHGQGGYMPVQQPYPQQQAAGPVFACWHCRTPLHWQSPHCARCGARPGPQGWPRIA